MAEYRDPNLVKLRSVNWPDGMMENHVGHGADAVQHNDRGEIWVTREHAAAMLKRGGYLIADDQS